jgi:hypothetical protein
MQKEPFGALFCVKMSKFTYKKKFFLAYVKKMYYLCTTFCGLSINRTQTASHLVTINELRN